jgi:hypothetical protein
MPYAIKPLGWEPLVCKQAATAGVVLDDGLIA